MVDINLFDDEEEKSGKRENDWDSTPDKPEGKKPESLKDDLNLDDDFGNTASLGDETLLGEEEVVPELDDSESKGTGGDYGSRSSKKKKTQPVYFVILALFFVIAVVYVYFMTQSRKGGGRKTLSSKQTASLTKPGSVSTARKGAGRTGASADSIRSVAATGAKLTGPIELAKTVFDDLSRQSQFGAILLDGERFAVEYVTDSPGGSQEMGKRIQKIIGISEFKSSPEEKHTLNGRTTYWGVISGTIAVKPVPGFQTTSAKFATADQFAEQVKGLAKQNKLAFVDVKNRFSGPSETRNAGFRLRGEGGKSQVLAWLEQISKFQPNCSVRTLFLVPMDYFDQKANNIKLVLDVSITLG
jgi:hypothetical protein